MAVDNFDFTGVDETLDFVDYILDIILNDVEFMDNSLHDILEG